MNIIVFQSPLHDRESVLSCRKSLFEKFALEGEVKFYSPEDEVLPKEDLVCFIATGGTEEIFVKTLDRLPRPIALLSDGYHNSLAATFEIATYLKRAGIEHTMECVPVSDEKEKTSPVRIYSNPKVKKYLAESRVGLIGGASSWLIASEIDREYIEKTHGTKFIDIDINEIVPGVDIYDSLRKIIDKYSLTALTIKCFDLLGSCRDTACLALGQLNSEGIVCGCEGDIPALWTMMVSYAISGKAPFMANPSAVLRTERSVDFAHCTIPVSMCDSYTLPTHFESGIGIAIAGILPLGPYGILKIGGSRLDEVFFETGEIVCNTKIAQRCRTQIRYRFDSEEGFNRFMNNRTGNHTIIVPPICENSESVEVVKENCAVAVGSGSVEVFATPSLAALMEKAALNAAAPLLEEGHTTVGTSLVLQHIKSSPIGEKVTAKASLLHIDGRRFIFKIVASDSSSVVGNCLHERFDIVG